MSIPTPKYRQQYSLALIFLWKPVPCCPTQITTQQAQQQGWWQQPLLAWTALRRAARNSATLLAGIWISVLDRMRFQVLYLTFESGMGFLRGFGGRGQQPMCLRAAAAARL